VKRELVNECAKAFRVPAEVLVGRGQRLTLMPARFALYKALKLRGWSYLAIGSFLGRDHTTIMYGVKRAEWMAERDAEYADKIERIAAWKPAAIEETEQ
jgi:chromosomal replication initiation ATPase DnaA